SSCFWTQERKKLRLVHGFIFQECEEAFGHSEAEGGGHAVFHCSDIVLIESLRFLISFIAKLLLLFKSCALILRVVELAESLADLGAGDDDLQALDGIGIAGKSFGKRFEIRRHAYQESGAGNPSSERFPKMIN